MVADEASEGVRVFVKSITRYPGYSVRRDPTRRYRYTRVAKARGVHAARTYSSDEEKSRPYDSQCHPHPYPVALNVSR